MAGIQLPANSTGEKLKGTIAGTVNNAADGNVQHVRLDDGDGAYLGESATPLRVDPTGSTTQPVSASALPLPTGASTLAEQQSQTTHLATLAGAVSGSEAQVDVVSSALPSGAATLAEQQTQTTSLAAIETAVELLDNAVSGNALLVRKPTVSQASANGTAITSATDTSLVAAPSAGNHLRILRLHASNAGATASLIEFRDGAAGSRRYPCYLQQGAVVSVPIDGGWNLTTATALYATTSAAGSVHWHVDYETVAD